VYKKRHEHLQVEAIVIPRVVVPVVVDNGVGKQVEVIAML
jgi:thiazole synthase ThiGH ThiG subunit